MLIIVSKQRKVSQNRQTRRNLQLSGPCLQPRLRPHLRPQPPKRIGAQQVPGHHNRLKRKGNLIMRLPLKISRRHPAPTAPLPKMTPFNVPLYTSQYNILSGWMIRGYKKEQVIDTTDNCTYYKASKNGKSYLMQEFDEINESDQYTFKIRKKLSKCSHIIPLEEEFEEKDCKYFISQYIEMDLLKLAHSRNGHVLQLPQALEFFARTIEVIDQMHANKLIYRNLRPEKIRFKENQPYFYDFSMSQFLKRKERLFEVVGCGSYLAPEFFSEDGYGQEVDIWAAGVLLFYLLVHEYPFKFKSEEQNGFKEEFNVKCADGFKFSQEVAHTNFNVAPLKGNKNLQDFFKRIFHLNPFKRITVSEIKAHPLFSDYFPQQIDNQMLQVIRENGRQQSVFLSKMYKFPCSKILHKEEIILDFIEQTSQLFLLQCPEIYSEALRYKAQFSILKVGLIKCNNLIDIFYGKKDPYFKIDSQEWAQVRGSSALSSVKQKLERKRKILHMLYKNAYLNVKVLDSDPFFKEEIPETFDEIKIAYRGNLSEMFEFGRKSLSKARGNRQLSRKLTQSLVRVIILFLVNRLFQSQEQISVDFPQYLAWSKKKDLEDLQQWIQTQQLANLKLFMKSVTSKYL